MLKDAQSGNPYALKAIAKAPKLDAVSQHYWTAFNILGSERGPGGMGMGQIPRSKAREYAEKELGLTPRETEAFLYIIRNADIHYLNAQHSKAEKRSKC